MFNLKDIPEKVPEICLIAPSRALANVVAELAVERGEDIGIYVAVLDEGLQVAKVLAGRGAKVFVSRKGTAALLNKNLDYNIVHINTTLNDYLRHLDLIKRYDGKIAIVEYSAFLPELKKLCNYIEAANVSIYGYENALEYEECVKRAVRDGAAILMGGGALLPEVAQRLGMPYTVVENTEESVRHALDAAKQILKVQKQEEVRQKNYQLQLEKYATVLNFTHDAIVGVDEEGFITVVNPVALQLLRMEEKDCVGKEIRHMLPSLHFDAFSQKREAEINQIIKLNETFVSINKIPIILNGNFEGAVFTFQTIKEIQESEQKIRLKLYKKGYIAKYDFCDIIGRSPAIGKAIQTAQNYAKSSSTILITGETGTGKELFAQSIHRNSLRKDGPFVAINCAALSKELLGSELFGYEEGSFTGAVKGGKAGLFEIAHGGTIFLDEIGEIPVETQIQLLRVLQEKEIRRIGSDRVLPVDVRVICATNKDLAKEVNENRFRKDLFYRINILKLKIPSLREREVDISLIVENFLIKFCPENYQRAVDYMQGIYPRFAGYDWPGNIRELLGVVQRIATLLDQDCCLELDDSMIMENMKNVAGGWTEYELESGDVERLGKSVILNALRNHAYNREKTARALQISRSTLWRLMKKHDIG